VRRTGVSLILLTMLLLPRAAQADVAVPIGVLLPLTGPAASFGRLAQEGLKRCRREHLRLLVEDDRCDAAVAVSSYHRLVDAGGAHLFLGPLCGGAQQALAPLLPRNGAIAVVPTTASRQLRQPAGGRVFSTAVSAERESGFNAEELYRLGHRRVCLLYSENDNSRRHAEAFRAGFRGSISCELRFQPGDGAAVSGLLLRLRQVEPDALYVPDLTPLLSASLLRKLREQGLSALPVYSIYAAQNDQLLELDRAASDGLRYSYPEPAAVDAISAAAEEACNLLDDAAAKCGRNGACVLRFLNAAPNFDSDGMAAKALGLKVVKDGQFLPLPQP
jgi:branched-chain amino acid transport system substrate-binding protein